MRRTYNWAGGTYPSVTSVLGAAVAKPGLLPWAARVSAQATADALAGGALPEVAVTAGCKAPNAGRDAGGARGTDVHRTLHHLALGLPLPTVGAAAEPYVASLLVWWGDHEPEPILAEATVLNRTHGYAGTMDAIWAVGGRTLVVDAKTSAYRGPEEALQLAAYRYAEVICLPDGTEETMPEVDGCAVLAIAADGCELIDVAGTWEAFAAYRAALILATWMWAQ